MSTLAPDRVLQGHAGHVTCVAIDARSSAAISVASSSTDQTVKVWSVSSSAFDASSKSAASTAAGAATSRWSTASFFSAWSGGSAAAAAAVAGNSLPKTLAGHQGTQGQEHEVACNQVGWRTHGLACAGAIRQHCGRL